MKLISNFIPQDDILLPALTVHETLDYAARLRLESTSPGFRKRRVADVVRQLSLNVCEEVRVRVRVKG